ncbi:MAG: hypothetical protein HY897_16695 [Deltaproteobacteria bacterium]|nr:hypothetical protein [Deltaproteobacteria bacterium]
MEKKTMFVALLAAGGLWIALALHCTDIADQSQDVSTCPPGEKLYGKRCVKPDAGPGNCLSGPCPAGYACNKVTGECTPETDAGEDDAGEPDAVTADTGADAETTDDAGDVETPDTGTDAGYVDVGHIVCTPGELKCDGDHAVECNGNGRDWVLKEDCTPSCDPNKCITGCWDGVCTSKPKICEPLETHCCDYISHTHPPCNPCVEDDLCQCDVLGIEWNVKENCQTTFSRPCYQTYCRDNQGKVCTPADLRCSANTLMECKPDGTGWAEKEKCAGCCQQTAQSTACIEGAGTDNSACQSDCECKGGFICVGWGISGNKVCRTKCGPVTNCPDGQSCSSGYYCTPE